MSEKKLFNIKILQYRNQESRLNLFKDKSQLLSDSKTIGNTLHEQYAIKSI